MDTSARRRPQTPPRKARHKITVAAAAVAAPSGWTPVASAPSCGGAGGAGGTLPLPSAGTHRERKATGYQANLVVPALSSPLRHRDCGGGAVSTPSPAPPLPPSASASPAIANSVLTSAVVGRWRSGAESLSSALEVRGSGQDGCGDDSADGVAAAAAAAAVSLRSSRDWLHSPALRDRHARAAAAAAAGGSLRRLQLRCALRRWRGGVRAALFAQARRRVARTLLLTRPAGHGACVRAAHAAAHDVACAGPPLLDLTVSARGGGGGAAAAAATQQRRCGDSALSPVTLASFSAAQETARAAAEAVLAAGVAEIEAEVERRVAALAAAGGPAVPDCATVGELAAALGEAGTPRALKVRLADLAALAPLRRLCRYVVAERMAAHALVALTGLARAVARPDVWPGGVETLPMLLQASVSFPPGAAAAQPGAIVLSPSEDAVRRALAGAVRCATEGCGAAAAALATRAALHGRLARTVEAALRRTYEAAAACAEALRPVRDQMAWAAEEWPRLLGRWTAADDDGLSAVPAAEFAAVFAEVEAAAGAARARLCNVSVGVLRLNHGALRSLALPGFAAIAQRAQGCLLAAVAARAEVCRALLAGHLVELEARAGGLDGWVAWARRLEEIAEGSGEELRGVGEVAALFDVVEGTGAPCPPPVAALREALFGGGGGGGLRNAFLAALEAAHGHRASSLAARREALATRVEAAREGLRAVCAEAGAPACVDGAAAPEAALALLAAARGRLEEVRAECAACDGHHGVCGLPPPAWAELTDAADALDRREAVWLALREYAAFAAAEAEKVPAELDAAAAAARLAEFEALTLRLAEPAERGGVGEGDAVRGRLEEGVRETVVLAPFYAQLGSAAMKERHWAEVLAGVGAGGFLGEAGRGAASLTMRDLTALGVTEEAGLCERVMRTAAGENAIVCAMGAIEGVWDKTPFNLVEHGGSGGRGSVHLLRGLDETLTQLEDHQVQVQAVLTSRFVAGVQELVSWWCARLAVVADVLEEWVAVQKTWLYIEFIFGSPDIHEQLPEEAAMFTAADTAFRSLSDRAHAAARLIDVAASEEVLAALRSASAQLDTIQKRLEAFLETKRAAFPRFYFLSNDELLAILSDVRNSDAIQPHLIKIFDSIKSLTFAPDTPNMISSMVSAEGEVVPLANPFVAEGPVETWLLRIESGMKRTVHLAVHAALADARHSVGGAAARAAWYCAHPAQSVVCVDSLTWTAQVEEAIAASSLESYLVFYSEQLSATVDLVKTDLTRLQRGVVCTVILTAVHARAVAEELLHAAVASVEDFAWRRHLRYYWAGGGGVGGACVIRHSAAEFEYGCEYLGNQSRLVITPLTDRAYLTCTAALSMNLGAAPQGPAGTGKTESVKDLGKALARQVVVFNCSDGLNHKTMSRMFSGLAQAGAWACFDEFNRIPLEVLSVVAQSMLEISAALAARRPVMDFDGRHIRLHPSFGVFITMNPGYAGRTELPDNLKALFRPICMMIPDYTLVAEVMFYSEGFQEAAVLAKKMVQLYKLSSQQLSKQDHYDFGMRAVKSILVCAGALKRASPDEREDALLIRAMREANVPKFLVADTALFVALIGDLFPASDLRPAPAAALCALIEGGLEAEGLQVVPAFVAKVVQLFDTLSVRHGVMAVGQTMTGKTVLVNTLRDALARGVGTDARFYVPRVHALNPKSVTLGELYGDVSAATHEWTDGILSSIARGVVASADKKRAEGAPEERDWMVFDGPVDTLWSENLNTVLDDNRMLCLVNGERIKLPATASFVFEVQDLKAASPATVSRCGMVFLEPCYLDGVWRPAAASAVRRGAESRRWDAALLGRLLERVVGPALAFVRERGTEWVPSCDPQLVLSLLRLLEGLVAERMHHHHHHHPDRPDGGTAAATPAGKGGCGNTASESDDDDSEDEDNDDDALARSFSRSRRLSRGASLRGLHAAEQAAAARRASLPAAAGGDPALFGRLFAVALVWSVGGNLAAQSRAAFSDFVREALREHAVCEPPPQAAGGGGGGEGCLYDYTVCPESGGWRRWSEMVPEWRYDGSASYFSLVVPTTETVRQTALLGLLTSAGAHVLLNGPTGVGKSAVVQAFLSEGGAAAATGGNKGGGWTAFTMVFSAQTSAANVQDTLEAKLHKKRNALLGAPPGGRMLYFIDDASMPAPDVFGNCPPIELVRQVIGQGGFYDKKRLHLARVEDLVVVAACGLPGGGRAALTRRLTSRFHLLACPELSEASTTKIFASILAGFLEQGWDAAVLDARRVAATLVARTLKVYARVAAVMLPVPAKSHYTFNLRDLSRVVHGLLQASPRHVPDEAALTKVWVHEASRVFHDRLTDAGDRGWWWTELAGLLGKTWEEGWREMLFCDFLPEEEEGEGEGEEEEEEEGREECEAGEAASATASTASVLRAYREVRPEDGSRLVAAIQRHQARFNAAHKQEATGDLVFFGDAVAHLLRIARILRVPRGHALLVGVGGSGRSSLAAVAAAVCGVRLVRVALTRAYGLPEFREDLRAVVLEAGCGCDDEGGGGGGVAFFLSDSQVVDEAMLEDLSCLLSTGEVPNLLLPEDDDRVAAAAAPVLRARGVPDTRANLVAQFVRGCRERLRVVLAASPTGGQFRRRLRVFPSLLNCMTIDWFTPWPEQALLAVAARKLRKGGGGGGGSVEKEDEGPDSVEHLCVAIHTGVSRVGEEFLKECGRYAYTTPSSYLSLLALYGDVLAEYTTRTDRDLRKYSTGLAKLHATEGVVDQLKAELRVMQPQLEQAKAETEELMATVQEEQVEAESLRCACRASEAETQGIMDEAAAIKDECQKQLDVAMPAYHTAVAALKSLNKGDITEIKSMSSPPQRVKLVIEAVQLLLGEKAGWESAKKMMGAYAFLDRLREYDKDDVPAPVLKALKTYIDNEEFQPELVQKSSVAAMSLCLWVRAIDNYSAVAKEIGPKKEQLGEAQAQLAAAQGKLQAAQTQLRGVEEKVAGLQESMTGAAARKLHLEQQQQLTVVKLARAEALMSGLSAEKVRWTAARAQLEALQVTLVGTSLLSAACVAYAGPFTAAFRRTLVQGWVQACAELQVPCSEAFSLEKLVAPVRVRQWGIDGLPLDTFSVENATIVTQGRRWPLCIDPQAQAGAWIRNTERRSGLKVTKPTDPSYMRTLETAIRTGVPVLLEDVGETLDPVLDPILAKATYEGADGRLLIALGDSEVDYDPGFKLYITTRLANPHILPELQIKVTLVNFTVTAKGLEDQLLADVVGHERADLGQQQDKTVCEIAEAKDQLEAVESNILRLLAAASGDILDDEVLINTLREAKAASTSIASNLEEVERTSAEISAAMEEYRPVAARGSILHTAVSTVSALSHMYQHSLDFFKGLFNTTLRRTPVPAEPGVPARVAALIPAVTHDSFTAVCRGLFEADKALFAFLIAAEVLSARGDLPPAQWRFFLTGEDEAARGGADGLRAVLRAGDVPPLRGAAWKEWEASRHPAARPLPAPLEVASAWERLLTVRALRPDAVVHAVASVAREVLGDSFGEPPPFDLARAFADSSRVAPIILVLTAGTDPTNMFLDFAAERGFDTRKAMLSLGQSQGAAAETLIARAAERGEWVYLQNCHVYASWMPTLAGILDRLRQADSDAHEDFRLWLTTLPSTDFPGSVLQAGVKVTREPPSGLRASLRDSFAAVARGQAPPWEVSSGTRRRLCLALCFFHGLVQERRRYGALGWNVQYAWSRPDLDAALLTLSSALGEQGAGEDNGGGGGGAAALPWEELSYMTGAIHYGGRVTDSTDLRCLQCMLKRCLARGVEAAAAAADGGGCAARISFTEDGAYAVPDDEAVGTEEGVRGYIDGLPAGDPPPEVFGLHANADVTRDRNGSRRLLEALAGASSGRVAGGDDTAALEGVVASVAGGLPAAIDDDDDADDRAAGEAEDASPLGTFRQQEVGALNRLLGAVAASLRDMRAVLRGSAALSAETEALAAALTLGRVPAAWHRAGYLSLKGLSSWVRDTSARVEALRGWRVAKEEGGGKEEEVVDTRAEGQQPQRHWLPGFVFPQGFLTALLQTYSRARHVPIDEVGFRFVVGGGGGGGALEEARACDGAAVAYGLFLEGAGWNGACGTLRESASGVLYTNMPDILFQPVRLGGVGGGEDAAPAAAGSGEDEGCYECPLYKVSTRAGVLSTTGLSTNFVVCIDLPAGSPGADTWILRGAALLSMLDE